MLQYDEKKHFTINKNKVFLERINIDTLNKDELKKSYLSVLSDINYFLDKEHYNYIQSISLNDNTISFSDKYCLIKINECVDIINWHSSNLNNNFNYDTYYFRTIIENLITYYHYLINK